MEVSEGQEVTTIFGEKLKVLKVREAVPITKKGEKIGERPAMFLAKSGDSLCWFPYSYLEGHGKDGE